MQLFFPVIFISVIIALLSALEIFLLRALHRDWWQRRWVRRLSWCIPVTGSISVLLWTLGIFTGFEPAVTGGATAAAAVFVFGTALMLSLPFSGILLAIGRLRMKNRRRETIQPDIERRRLLTTSAALFPVVAISTGMKGFANSYRQPEFPIIPLYYPHLSPELDGFRILHISDVHIGLFISLADLEQMSEHSSTLRPDIVLVTGDFSDEADKYAEALRIVAQIPSTFGHYASLGNHEYFRGIDDILRAYEKGPIPLLFNNGATVKAESTELYIAGIDDPKSMRAMPKHFFERSIDESLNNAPSDAFTILMSHRPSAYDIASVRGVPLTLAGHTHGGQIGFNGRSLLYAINPEQYMWGLYNKGETKLYVSAGAGHWFPYRIGCPAEIPLYVLRKTEHK